MISLWPRGEGGGPVLFLLALLPALLLTPFAVQAQSISQFDLGQYGDLDVAGRVYLSGGASHFPAKITVDWGDGNSSWTTAESVDRKIKSLTNTYADCGIFSISLTVVFEGGSERSQSTSFSVSCPSNPVEGGPGHCDVQGCRQVPDYFIENQRALLRWIEDAGRREERGDFSVRPLSDFGYRCPDAGYNCATVWIPGPASNTGLSRPNSFAGSPIMGRSGAHIQRINASGIGVQSLVNQNPIDGIDVWGPEAASGGEVCFLGGEGRLIYLDARTSPRAQSELSSTVRGNVICATMPGPGSVVYLPPAG